MNWEGDAQTAGRSRREAAVPCGPLSARVRRLARERARVALVLGALTGIGGGLLTAAALAADGWPVADAIGLALAVGVGLVLAAAQIFELSVSELEVTRVLDDALAAEGELVAARELELRAAEGPRLAQNAARDAGQGAGQGAGLRAALSRRALGRVGSDALSLVCPQPALGIGAPLLGAAVLMFCMGAGNAVPDDLDVAGLARLSAEELRAFESVFDAAGGAVPDGAAQVRAAAALSRAERALEQVEAADGDVEEQLEKLAAAAEALDELAAELGRTPRELEAARAAVDSLARGLGDGTAGSSQPEPAGAPQGSAGEGPGAGAGGAGAAAEGGAPSALSAESGANPLAMDPASGAGTVPRGRARARRAGPTYDPRDVEWLSRYLDSLEH